MAADMAVNQSIPVFIFAAYSDTGKTTYIEKLVTTLKKDGLRVGVVKHDGHDFEIDRPGKDSYRFAQAGADVTAILSDHKAALIEYRKVALEEMLSRIQNVDLILVEGFKYEKYPKIALYREASGKGLAAAPEECLAVVSDRVLDVPCPVFSLEDAGELAEFLKQYL